MLASTPCGISQSLWQDQAARVSFDEPRPPRAPAILCNTGFARTTGCTDGDCDNGVGTWTYTDKTTYVGEWNNGLKHGQGTLTFPDGATYVGEWHDGFMNGQGTFTLADGTVKKGVWKNGELVEPN